MIIDDDPQARRTLKIALISQAFEVLEARSGEEALELLHREVPEVVLLDLTMPGIGGLEACRRIREFSDVPVMIVSARNTEREKVEALESGADDYVTKPIGFNELVARIHAITRRPGTAGHARILQLDGVEIDLESHEVMRDGRRQHLTTKEFKLFYFLLKNSGKVISHRRLLQAVWGPDYGDEVEYLRVFVNQLRKKIEPDPSHPRHLLTEPSTGYRFECDARVSTKS
jgi:two-component system KDP operon response regulator KdpE